MLSPSPGESRQEIPPLKKMNMDVNMLTFMSVGLNC